MIIDSVSSGKPAVLKMRRANANEERSSVNNQEPAGQVPVTFEEQTTCVSTGNIRVTNPIKGTVTNITSNGIYVKRVQVEVENGGPTSTEESCSITTSENGSVTTVTRCDGTNTVMRNIHVVDQEPTK